MYTYPSDYHGNGTLPEVCGTPCRKARRAGSLGDFGINVEGLFSDPRGWVSINCPRCSHLRKKSRERCLGVNLIHGWWTCHHADCKWRGNLRDGETHPSEMTPEKFWANDHAKQKTHAAMAPNGGKASNTRLTFDGCTLTQYA